tara:strand:+ start:1124 stop:1750 length:627 start_codon:yes stop_codon:yes gene_type:complete
MEPVIIDNFLNELDFKKLSNLDLKKIKKNEIHVYHNQINLKDEVISECLTENTVRDLQNSYHEKAINLLKKLCPEKLSLYEYSEFHIIETGADYKYPIHDDTPNKLLSGVVYLKPSINSGTSFYKNKKGDGKKEILWKQNRAVFFSRKERETWHSYKGDGKNNRLALVYNLMTNDIRKVCKLENKSFFITKFRHSINPYLYRYFKRLI